MPNIIPNQNSGAGEGGGGLSVPHSGDIAPRLNTIHQTPGPVGDFAVAPSTVSSSTSNEKIVDAEVVPEWDWNTSTPGDRMLFDFGHYGEFEKNLVESLVLLSENTPGGADEYIRAVRESIHIANATTPSDRDGPDLESRKRFYSTFSMLIQDRASQIRQAMPEGADRPADYLATIFNHIDHEVVKIQNAEQFGFSPSSRPSLSSVLGNLFRSKPRPLGETGSLRDWRNRELGAKLDQLNDLTSKLISGLGDPAWESVDGLQIAKNAKSVFRETQDLMSGVWRQGDDSAFQMRFDTIQKKFQHIETTTSNKELKKTIAEITKQISEFISNLLSSIGLKRSAPKP